MKILVFEWLVGGGIAGGVDMPSNDPFLVQGAGMYGAIVDDCLRMGVEVLSALDPHLSQAIANFDGLRHHDNFHITPINLAQDLKPTLRLLAEEADHVFLIAPECEGILTRCLQWLDGFQSKLVCGPQSLIEIFADKNETQQSLKSRGIPVPNGVALPPKILASPSPDGGVLSKFIAATEGLSWPLVLKPSGGAGGDGVLLCHNQEQLEVAVAQQENTDEVLRVERYIAGVSASVSIARNENETRLMPGTEQRFSNRWSDGAGGAGGETEDSENLKNNLPHSVGHFVESVYPLDARLERRAATLAAEVARALPQWRGYLGVDMVLANDGPDVVVELNPRLTASYLTIRAETAFNLMEFLLGGE